MSCTRTYDAIVLRTHDVGEADRFCILLTKERGRIAARARGVRKLQSRIGGSILPLRRMVVEMHEGKTGFTVTGVHGTRVCNLRGAHAFTVAMQGMVLILNLLQDEEPVHGIFEATWEFINRCGNGGQLLLTGFAVHVLHEMGLMPEPGVCAYGMQPSEDERVFLKQCTQKDWYAHNEIRAQSGHRIAGLCKRIITEQGWTPQNLPLYTQECHPARTC